MWVWGAGEGEVLKGVLVGARWGAGGGEVQVGVRC